MADDAATTSLDIEQPEALLNYLRSSGVLSRDVRPTLRVLEGGVSNRTVLVEFEDPGSGREVGWVLKQALAKLRVKADWYSDPSRILREAQGLRWLARLAPAGAITPFVFEDRRHHILAMQAVPEPHDNLKTLLLRETPTRAMINRYAEGLGVLLGTIHRASHERAPEVTRVFEDRTFFETLRVEPYYRYTAGRVAPAKPFLDLLITDTLATRITLVHGDFSPKNVLVYDHRLVLLDHEVIHWGDPAFDVGFCTAHLLSKAHHLRDRRADFAAGANAFWSAYAAKIAGLGWASPLEARAVRHSLACVLARVEGRSPLEYLTVDQRLRQSDTALRLMGAVPATMPALIERFVSNIERAEGG